jgi:nitric oxide reductase subunit B
MEKRPSTPSNLSPWWRHAVILVMIVGFSVLAIVTALTYSNAPPIPSRVTDMSGGALFTREDVEQGQAVFFKYGLMEHGSLWGHGAYLGPDYTAEYLHREAEIARNVMTRQRFGTSFDSASLEQQALISAALVSDLQENRYDPASGELRFTAEQVAAYRQLGPEWAAYFGGEDLAPGLPAGYIRNPGEIEALNAFLAWATWATVTRRPGKDYSYTNNWPYERLVGNTPSTETYVWSALSIVSLLSGLGLALLAFGKFHFLGWEGKPGEFEAVRAIPGSPGLTPSQAATAKYFAVVAGLFLLQALGGGALAHYRVEPHSFYGLDFVAGLLP